MLHPRSNKALSIFEAEGATLARLIAAVQMPRNAASTVVLELANETLSVTRKTKDGSFGVTARGPVERPAFRAPRRLGLRSTPRL